MQGLSMPQVKECVVAASLRREYTAPTGGTVDHKQGPQPSKVRFLQAELVWSCSLVILQAGMGNSLMTKCMSCQCKLPGSRMGEAQILVGIAPRHCLCLPLCTGDG